MICPFSLANGGIHTRGLECNGTCACKLDVYAPDENGDEQMVGTVCAFAANVADVEKGKSKLKARIETIKWRPNG